MVLPRPRPTPAPNVALALPHADVNRVPFGTIVSTEANGARWPSRSSKPAAARVMAGGLGSTPRRFRHPRLRSSRRVPERATPQCWRRRAVVARPPKVFDYTPVHGAASSATRSGASYNPKLSQCSARNAAPSGSDRCYPRTTIVPRTSARHAATDGACSRGRAANRRPPSHPLHARAKSVSWAGVFRAPPLRASAMLDE